MYPILPGGLLSHCSASYSSQCTQHTPGSSPLPSIPQRELAIQQREDEVRLHESALLQESLRLQQLADQLHKQKMDLDHREFVLQMAHYAGERGPGSREGTQLTERLEENGDIMVERGGGGREGGRKCGVWKVNSAHY